MNDRNIKRQWKKNFLVTHTPIWRVINVFLVTVLFNFYHALLWTHRSLRLWWQQVLLLTNLFLPSLCLMLISWIMPFFILVKQLACIIHLLSSILPSKNLTQPSIISFKTDPFNFENFWGKQNWDLNLK